MQRRQLDHFLYFCKYPVFADQLNHRSLNNFLIARYDTAPYGLLYKFFSQYLFAFQLVDWQIVYLSLYQCFQQGMQMCRIGLLGMQIRVVIFQQDGKDGQPIVTHGHTLTSKIYFKEIIQVVKTNGFEISPYPVILSLEIHCSIKQQQLMTSILKEILGPMLFQIPPNYQQTQLYPSPEELKYKVIVKGVGNIYNIHNGTANEISQYENEENQDDLFDNLQINDYSENDAQLPQQQQQQEVYMKESTSGDITDEITFDEHTKKHDVHAPPEFKYKMYREFNLNNPDFKNFKNYFKFIGPQNRTVTQMSEIDSSALSKSPYKGLINDEGSWMNQESWTQRYTPGRSSTPSMSISSRSTTLIKKQGIRKQSNVASEMSLITARKKTIAPKKKVVHSTHIDLERCLSLFSFKLTFDNKRLVWQITSLSETQLAAVIKKSEVDLIKFHQRFFSRIFPKGTRFDSSNYDPLPGFIMGSQVIALNYQTMDENLMIYLSKFKGNKGYGYVLKPVFLLNDQYSKLKSNSFYYEYFRQPKLRIVIEFISAQQLRPQSDQSDSDVVDPYIEVFVKGIGIDELNNPPMRSKVIKNNGFNPIFNYQVEFKLACPENTFLIIRVMDKDVLKDEMLGVFAIPVTYIRSGFRVIPLLNQQLNQIDNCYLFTHVELILVPIE